MEDYQRLPGPMDVDNPVLMACHYLFACIVIHSLMLSMVGLFAILSTPFFPLDLLPIINFLRWVQLLKAILHIAFWCWWRYRYSRTGLKWMFALNAAEGVSSATVFHVIYLSFDKQLPADALPWSVLLHLAICAIRVCFDLKLGLPFARYRFFSFFEAVQLLLIFAHLSLKVASIIWALLFIFLLLPTVVYCYSPIITSRRYEEFRETLFARINHNSTERDLRILQFFEEKGWYPFFEHPMGLVSNFVLEGYSGLLGTVFFATVTSIFLMHRESKIFEMDFSYWLGILAMVLFGCVLIASGMTIAGVTLYIYVEFLKNIPEFVVKNRPMVLILNSLIWALKEDIFHYFKHLVSVPGRTSPTIAMANFGRFVSEIFAFRNGSRVNLDLVLLGAEILNMGLRRNQ